MSVLIEEKWKNRSLRNKILEVRYAWANEKLKTWFLTKTPKEVVPKGCRLLLELKCESTTDPVSIKSVIPEVGGVVIDTDGTKLKIIEKNWY